MAIYKLTGRAHLKDIGRFFRMAGTNIFRFMPGELGEMSDELLAAVKRYVPVDTGILKSQKMRILHMQERFGAMDMSPRITLRNTVLSLQLVFKTDKIFP